LSPVVEAARAASPEDLPRLAELAAEAIAELTTTKGGAIWARRDARAEPLEAGLAADLADPLCCVLVATIDDVVMGYAVARREVLRDGAPMAVLSDIFVDPGCRGIGLGEALMDEVVAWAEGEGCIGIDSLALPGNRETKNFFETFGLVARAIVVHRPLGGDA
jgi:GNAT superfamily N-acetyltransferase